MNAYLTPLLSVIVAIVGAMSEQIQGLVASHPILATIAAAVGVIAAAFAPQPGKK